MVTRKFFTDSQIYGVTGRSQIFLRVLEPQRTEELWWCNQPKWTTPGMQINHTDVACVHYDAFFSHLDEAI